MRVLITGGAGFIGSRTATLLAKNGDEVVILDTLSPQIHGPDPTSSPTAIEARRAGQIVVGDICNRELVHRLVADSDAILHLAAETGTGQSMYDIVHYNTVNVVGTANLLEALVETKTVRRLVVASSRSVYGEGAYQCAVHGLVQPGERDVSALAEGHFDPVCPLCAAALTPAPTREEDALAPASVYAVTKLAQENLMLAMGRAFGIPTVALRYQNVYGPGQSLNNPYTGILSIFSREMLAGRPIEIFEDGKESRDFVHVNDVARANVSALRHELSGTHVVNIGTGQATSVATLTKALAEAYGYAHEPKVSGRFRAGDIRHNFADIARASSILGWRPAIDFESGINGFCQWVRDAIDSDDGGPSYAASLAELADRGLMGGGR
jgi:dTDP-L-rhamnose 4-epimerase